jgi:hypothetical protein
MEGDCKAVRLISYSLQEIEPFTTAVMLLTVPYLAKIFKNA